MMIALGLAVALYGPLVLQPDAPSGDRSERRDDRAERRDERQEKRDDRQAERSDQRAERNDKPAGPTFWERVGGFFGKVERTVFAPLELLDLAWQMMWTVRAAIVVAGLYLIVWLFKPKTE